MEPELALKPDAAQIIVVEDDVILRAAIADALRDFGFQVIEASSADEAWSYLVTADSIDLIFSDVQMPGSMNGIELAHAVRQRFPDVPFLLTSGARSAELSEHRHFVPKPYGFAAVIRLINDLLECED